MMARERFFSIPESDFTFTPYKGSGPGGQHRNKAETAVRCTHPPSGAVGRAEDHRSQHRNKRLAFERCTATPEFQAWIRKESARRSGAERAVEDAINRRVNAALRPANLLIEVGDGDTWRPEGDDPADA